jgi:hypothetical protein
MRKSFSMQLDEGVECQLRRDTGLAKAAGLKAHVCIYAHLLVIVAPRRRFVLLLRPRLLFRRPFSSRI